MRRSVSDQVLSLSQSEKFLFFFAFEMELNFILWFVAWRLSELFFFVNGVAFIQLSSAKIESWYAVTMQPPVSVDYRFYIKIKGLLHLYLCIQFWKRCWKGKSCVLFHQKNTGLVQKFLVKSVGRAYIFSPSSSFFFHGYLGKYIFRPKKILWRRMEDTFWWHIRAKK